MQNPAESVPLVAETDRASGLQPWRLAAMRWLKIGGMRRSTTTFTAIVVGLACSSLGLLVAQGVVGRDAKAMPKPKPSGRTFPVSFTDVAAVAGLRAPQISGADQKKYIVETMGLGVAFPDYNNDGWPDIFLVNGSRLEPSGGAAPTNHLYRNNRDGTFTDVTVKARLARSGWGQSVAVGDFDNDGFTDLFITYWGQNVLYRNNGDETFTDVSARAGVAGEGVRWGSGASFFDYDRDGLLDLFVANYLDLDLKRAPLPGSDPRCAWMGLPVVCGPRGLPFSSNLLYRNNGDGTFTDVSRVSGIGEPRNTYALGVLAADLDADGWQDVYVASDSTRSLFMGLALGDYDGDGLLDIVKTNFSDDYPNLYRNSGKSDYSDRTLSAGLGVNPQYVLWSPIFADFDNDGWIDLFMSAGHFFSEVDRLKTAQRFRNPRLLYWNLGNGKFEDVSDRSGPGIAAAHSSRGAEAGDFDNDGNIDLLIMNMNEPPSLLKNRGKTGNNWLKVKLTGRKSNRAGIGAKVRVTSAGKTQTRVALSQSGFYSSPDARLHFGLGSAASVDLIEITWPCGLVETWDGLKPNQVFSASEGSGRKLP
jgi:hypothetical protein